MQKITTVVITFNEERNIGRCLTSLQNIADEIIVVDSFSTDRTEEICKSFNVKFYQRIWDDFSSAKNAGNEKASHDWILSLDADEALSDELKKNILDVKNKNRIGNYKFNRLTNYCGKWIRHCGWYPDTKTRLFLRTQCHWEGTIHEKLVIKNNAPVHFLKGDLLHYSYVTTEEFISKQNKYAETSAVQLYDNGARANFFHVYIKSPVKFFRDYIFHLGFLDGKEGYTISRVAAKAVYKKYKRLSELQRSH
jgi:glycosyltransferase involved in cell wall biosynthesis